MCSSLIIAILVTIGIIITVCSCCGSSLVASSLLAFTMLRTPCELAPVFSVTGGGINPSVEDPCSGSAWIITPYTVGGKQFGDMYNRNYYCKKYVGNDFAMVEHLKDLRNKKVQELMKKLSAEEDPNADAVQSDGIISGPKRDLFDRLNQASPILTISVKTTSMVVAIEVNVLPDWRVKGVLKLEITKTNLDLLLEKPSAATPPWIPIIEQPNVFFRPSSNTVYCRYWDSYKVKSRVKSMKADFNSEMDHIEKRDIVNHAASEVQAFYESHHNRSGNMPVDCESEVRHKRDRDSDDEDDPVTAPVSKASRKTCAETETASE